MTVTDPRRGGANPMQQTDVSAADFRHAIGHFATGVTIITASAADGMSGYPSTASAVARGAATRRTVACRVSARVPSVPDRNLATSVPFSGSRCSRE